jgi:dolichol-phosphate mannosyltransferase
LGLSEFWEELEPYLKEIQRTQQLTCIAIFVDDGSTDSTWSTINHIISSSDVRSMGIRFVTNFGHQAAIQAGCDRIVRCSDFDAESLILIMDSDGQHPAEALSSMVTKLRSGVCHVQMVREDSNQSIWKRLTSGAFYRCFRFLSRIDMPAGAADFRGFTGAVLANYLKFGETGRFNRGLFFLAQPPEFIPYVVQPRKFGRSKYNFAKMLKFALVGVTYFSNRPLLLAALGSCLFGFFSCTGYLIFELRRYLAGIIFQPGWFTIMAWISFWGMLLSFCILLLAIYLARVFDETKKRPIYLVREESE